MKQTTKSEKTKLIKKLIRLGFTETRAKEFLDEIIATRAELYSVNRPSAVLLRVSRDELRLGESS
jgi:hypothetical protein